MEFSAAQIAAFINGTVVGDPETLIHTIGKIENGQKGSLSFIANPKYEHYLYTTEASVLIVNESFEPTASYHPTLIKVKDAYAALATLLELYEKIVNGSQRKGIEQPSFISATAKVPESAYIGAFAYIGENVVIGENAQIFPQTYIGNNSEIGDYTIINPGVKIYNQTKIGQHCIIHSGCVIGADGFGFAPQPDGSYKKVSQVGNVIIEDLVEIGANTCIDRATMGSTLIHKGTKLDNLLQIAHNVEIGEHVAIAAQTGISGSTKIGNRVLIGGQVGIVGHIQIADGTKINAQSGISKTITEENTILNGSPAYEYKSSLKSQVIFRNLPNLLERIYKLERKIKELSK